MSEVTPELERSLAEAREKLAKVVEALTPSGKTKGAYHGEFCFLDENGFRVMVPWTTVKEILSAIRDRAALAAAKGEE